MFVNNSAIANTQSTPTRILIADDDPVFRHLLESLLTRWGYEVATASDGTEAWNVLLQTDAPNLAIIDWLMPGVDGVELCQRIKAEFKYRAVYAILVTAHQRGDDCVLALEAGADDFIAKPISPAELLARVRAGARIVDYQRLLQSMALEDPLTALGNRRAFAADLERLSMYSLRHGWGFAMMIADIDGFKKINDLYGHDVGDTVLQQVATALSSTFRAEDSSYRLGGDEFGTLFPGISTVESIPVERLKSKLKTLLASAQIEGLSVDTFSLSIGVACHTSANPLNAEEIYRCADQQMYASKCRMTTH